MKGTRDNIKVRTVRWLIFTLSPERPGQEPQHLRPDATHNLAGRPVARQIHSGREMTDDCIPEIKGSDRGKIDPGPLHSVVWWRIGLGLGSVFVDLEKGKRQIR